MQLGRFAFIIAVFSLTLFPVKSVLAESGHFDLPASPPANQFISADQTFKLTLPADKFTKPVDVYLFRLPYNNVNHDLNVLTEIYSYYVYTDEVTDQSEFSITISYQGDQPTGKTIYYLNPASQKWELASQQAFLNNLTFKLPGRENQLAVVGTNLAQQTAVNQDKVQVSEIFNFNIDPALSQLTYEKVCPPYLTGQFKSAKTNTKEEVKKLQTFLRENEGFKDLPSTGYYGNATFAAVRQFQERYASTILTPQGIKTGTGWVLGATLDKINQVYCQKNPEAYSYQVSFPYQTSSKQAKNAYQLINGQWEKLESYDDYKILKVTAIIKADSARLDSARLAKVALFEEADQWVGQASWYAWKNGLYAASRDFPKGTRIKVTNQSVGKYQGKSVIVEVNDYGPELKTGRIIDLDKKAFQQIGLTSSGVLPVRIELVK